MRTRANLADDVAATGGRGVPSGIDAGSDALLALAATFKLGCAGSAFSAYGEIRYNSAIPWATITPSPTSVAFGTDPIGRPAVERTVTFASKLGAWLTVVVVPHGTRSHDP